MKDWFSGIRPGDLIQRIRGKRSNSTIEDLEDAVQDVYLRALERARSHNPPPSPINADAYLMRSVHNALNSLQRRGWREIQGVDPEVFETAGEHADRQTPHGLHEAVERAQLFGLLADMLRGESARCDNERLLGVFARLQDKLAGQLTPKHWILIRMRVLDNMGYVECAEQLGIAVGTAHNWARKALAIVREALEDCGVGPGALACSDTEGDEA